MGDAVALIVSILLTLILGILFGYLIRVKHHEETLTKSREQAKKIVEDGKKEADDYRKQIILEAKQEIHNQKADFERDIKERRANVVASEERLARREEMLNNRSNNLDKREDNLALKELKLDEKKAEIDILNSKVEELLVEQEQRLVEISGMSVEQAREIIMKNVEEAMSDEITAYLKDREEEAMNEADMKAKELLTLAIQKYASDITAERTVSVVDLPSEEMKGRVIGREGRNIRTFEALTGVDLIIDDTPEAVVLSGFDPIRREVARRALVSLVDDGRIHPGRIEEVVIRSQAEVDTFIREVGENAVFEANVGKVHPDLIKLLGRLNFRTSYGQNVLRHSIEVAFLAGKLAAELGQNETLARRAGLFHDIGKAVDHEVEGSHVDIGVDLVRRYKEPKEVIDAIASHHGDKEPKTIIAALVAAADAVSAARPGARSESVENYLKRLEALEGVATNVEGVDKAYAIQAGREIRVVVQPEKIDDQTTFKIARQIKEEIEATLQYPGTIKVTVIRETRATDVAK
ncbi:MAG TPA: ribonuclease Y [Acholeplasma sp.]|jgi:ribonuclease Y|nr:ribonuclease Y [Acholeplasmatales bacterium]HHV33102.1 ribonuclease Y [Acholeplasma sp.]